MQQSEINHKLLNKDWTFMSDNKPDSLMMGRTIWAFQPVKEGATAWYILYYSDKSPSRILYNSYVGRGGKAIQKYIRRRKMLLLREGNQLDSMINLDDYKDYGDANYVIRSLTYTQPGSYGIKIFQKEDYLKYQKRKL